MSLNGALVRTPLEGTENLLFHALKPLKHGLLTQLATALSSVPKSPMVDRLDMSVQVYQRLDNCDRIPNPLLSPNLFA